ncbi:MAG: hypothetical protein QOJ78_466 [Pseudonocardiales bacterium]|nr:hypothetical protein [Pseudonocardiales bacterium]
MPASASPDVDDPAAELLQLLCAEFAGGGIDSEVIPADSTVPAQLVVAIEGAVVNVCFLPGLENPPVMQYLAVLDCEVVPGTQPAVARLVCTVNSSLPVTGFEFSEAAEAVVFRHVQALSVHPLDPAVIAWPLSMIHYAVSHYAPIIASVASGSVELDAAVTTFALAQQELFDTD